MLDDSPLERARALASQVNFTVVRPESIVGHRIVAIGGERTLGQEAIFSRYNVSINMTRTIGDKFGPRCCISQPEVSSVVLAPEDSARIVIASDGVWDVMTNAQVGALVFSSISPRAAARRISNAAASLRDKYDMRPDDISVVVVDVNMDRGGNKYLLALTRQMSCCSIS